MSLAQFKSEAITDKQAFDESFLNDEGSLKCIGIKDANGYMKEIYLLNDKIKEFKRNSNKDCYICINDVKNWKREDDNIKAYNGFFVDVDFKNVNMTQEVCLMYLYQLLDDKNILEPTMIFNSGTGLYLLWRIEKVYCNSDKITLLWKQIEDDLINAFKKIGADKSVRAPSNLIRLPGSYNQKNGMKTSLIAYNGLEYQLSDFRTEVSTYDKANSIRSKKYLLNNVYNLNVSRVLDIEKLFELREYDVKGMRNIMLFAYRNQLNLAEDENAEEKVIEMNNRLLEPLNKRELSYLNSDRKRYTYRNQSLIDFLKINDDEIQQMRTIITVVEKRRRRQLYDKKRYEPIKQANKAKKEERNKKVKQLIAEGYTQKEVSEMLKINQSTISRILKK